MFKKNIVLFDLDGTVIDSKLGIFNSIYYTFDKLGMETPSEDILNLFIGPSVGSSFRKFCHMPDELADKAVLIYREYYKEKGVQEFQVYDGIETLFQSLKNAGKKIAIATKKPEPFAVTMMENAGLTRYLDAVCGSALAEKDTSKSHIIKRAADLFQPASYDEVVMIGDTKYDVIGAKEVNIDCIGVLYGFGSEKELNEYGAVAIAKDMNELYQILCEK